MHEIVQVFFKQSSADDRQSLVILTSSTKNYIGNKSATFAPKDRYYNPNKWYALSKSEKDKVIKARKGKKGGKNASK